MTRRRPKRQRAVPRVLSYLQPCPDCAARFDGLELMHEPTCPIARGVDDVCDADRAYFEAHPDDWHYTRAITRAERLTLEHLDPVGAATNPDHVHVLWAPGGRIRQFCNSEHFASMAIDPDDEQAS